MIEIKAPSPGESVSEVQLAAWLVADKTWVEKGTEIAEIESEKATLSIAAPYAGIIYFDVKQGETIAVGAIIARIDASAVRQVIPAAETTKIAGAQIITKSEKDSPVISTIEPTLTVEHDSKARTASYVKVSVSPIAARMMSESGIDASEVGSHLLNLRITREVVDEFIRSRDSKTSATSPASMQPERITERIKMSSLRLKLSQRLVAVKQETAMLTTFNEVNMSDVMELRRIYSDEFKHKYGVGIGLVSIFAKATALAIKDFPQINSMISGNEIIYHHYLDLGIAVSAPKGLMVPVIRNAEQLSLAELEIQIKEMATRARENKITLDEMSGGTFTITNGGVFGSMLSTPILNPPQSAILGMHNIVERPIAIGGKIEIAPIMYVALSYDHRVIDGRESVGFLVRVKELVEKPAKMLFGGVPPERALLGI
ncbi:MAG TPA: 2-oxoglutarate dehydrogenase complex dihydrolipoyllysine-residue succinyltransferase [Bacteroidales bacterium]|nr:2-oxoglutarate dehydrogenase complex dihydrolipoyllysine-residue succinyltransferase [Bacteroidales bacterium]